MGIPHFEDLDLTAILDVLDLHWTACEKLDGACLIFGLDEDGRYYSNRKGAERCYSVDDWADEGWTNAFRAGHQAAEEVADFLVERSILWPGQHFICEVLFGARPNTVPYANSASLAITGWSYSKDLSPVAFALKGFGTMVNHQVYHSYDARSRQLVRLTQKWNILVVEPIEPVWIWARLKTYADCLKRQVIRFRDEVVMGSSRGDLMAFPLNRRPQHIDAKDWPVVKEHIRENRSLWQRDIVPELRIFRDTVLRALVIDQSTLLVGSQFSEGLVVTTWIGNQFKFVDRKGFTEANKFAHWVKYSIVGGRRPKRPCFLSRTADWPIEKRLNRLDVLAERYLRHHHQLEQDFRNCYKFMPVSYTGTLHERTKLLFADVRLRIMNGR